MPILRGAVESPLLKQVLGNDIPGNNNMDVEVIRQVMEEAKETPNFRRYSSVMSVADSKIGSMISVERSIDSRLLKLQREINSMLRAVGYGFAMENASENVKKQVGNVTKSNEEDGIWEVVKGL